MSPKNISSSRRDAHTGGDPVAAENYLQHAEHYFRLIASAQAAQALAQSGQPRPPGEESEDLEDDGDFGALSDRFASPAERQNAYQQPQPGFPPHPGAAAPNAPQPFGDRPAYEAERQGGADRGGFAPRQDRQNNNRFPDRGPRPDRPFQDRGENYRDNRQGRDSRPRDFRPYRNSQPQPPREGGADPAPSRPWPSVLHNEKPKAQQHGAATRAYPKRSLRQPRSRPPEPAPDRSSSWRRKAYAFPARGRRRRLRSPYGFGAANSGRGRGSRMWRRKPAEDTPVEGIPKKIETAKPQRPSDPVFAHWIY